MKVPLSAATALCAVFITAEPTSAQRWIQLTNAPGTLWSCALSADGSKMIVGSAYNGPVYTSADSGATWRTNNLPSTFWTAVASSADGSKLVAAAGHPGTGLIYTSTNAGATWSPCFPYEMWECLASSADGSVLVAGTADYQGIFTSTNSGINWSSANNGSFTFYLSVASSADGTKLATVGGINASNWVYLSTNSGALWSTSSAPVLNWYAVASSADGSKLVVAGPDVTPNILTGIYTSTDSGTSWRSNYVAGAVHAYWTCLASSADGTRLAAASYGYGIYLSTNSGASWFDSGAPRVNWNNLCASADGNKFLAVAEGGNAYVWQGTCAPVLKGAATNGGLLLSWTIPSANFVLQQNNDLASTNWITATNAPVLDFSTLRQQVWLSSSNGSGFYRLKTP